MVSFKAASLLACSAVSGVLAIPATLLPRQSITSSTTGTNNGYYYSVYIEENTGATYTNGAAGEYTLDWSSSAVDVVAGKGWATGSDRTITYSANGFTPSGDSLLSVYGWTTSPLHEYYIIETYGSYNPGSAGTHVGTVTSDGSTYDIYTNTRTNAPSIQGTQTFVQFLSIRQSKRTSGTVTTANHFNAWAKLGLTLGTFNYQIMAIEGYESSGSATVTVS
ncbi:MAG: hypothetical protein M1821_002408 [Bathelium mastoideum]|nr:MAG: hypothetical protein M1821_002408 [Bathelium mastoideum]KAI9686382.1 MAG: hypothetical protein M1822_003727 [Bathelium mastoideum]